MNWSKIRWNIWINISYFFLFIKYKVKIKTASKKSWATYSEKNFLVLKMHLAQF